MNAIDKHVERLFREIDDCQEKQEILEEIKLNLREKVSDLIHEGKSEEDAINKAIVDFGDIDEIKKELYKMQSGKDQKLAFIRLGYSIWGSVLIIALFVFINLYFSPKVIWFPFPIFALLWWPLSMFFSWLKRR